MFLNKITIFSYFGYIIFDIINVNLCLTKHLKVLQIIYIETWFESFYF